MTTQPHGEEPKVEQVNEALAYSARGDSIDKHWLQTRVQMSVLERAVTTLRRERDEARAEYEGRKASEESAVAELNGMMEQRDAAIADRDLARRAADDISERALGVALDKVELTDERDKLREERKLAIGAGQKFVQNMREQRDRLAAEVENKNGVIATLTNERIAALETIESMKRMERLEKAVVAGVWKTHEAQFAEQAAEVERVKSERDNAQLLLSEYEARLRDWTHVATTAEKSLASERQRAERLENAFRAALAKPEGGTEEPKEKVIRCPFCDAVFPTSPRVGFTCECGAEVIDPPTSNPEGAARCEYCGRDNDLCACPTKGVRP